MTIHIAGASFAVVFPDGDTLHRSFGHRNIFDSSSTIDQDSVFHIASMTKLFTAFAIGLTIDDQDLWTTPINNLGVTTYFQDQNVKESINLIDLLSHRTGFPRRDDLLIVQETNEVIQKSVQSTFSSGFRESFTYNNYMFVYLILGTL